MAYQKITLATADGETARRVHGFLGEAAHPAPAALTLFSDDAGWTVEAYYTDPAGPASVGEQLAAALAAPLPPIVLETVADRDWVAISQAALPPVRAGRFTVHGSHDRGRVGRGPNRIEIDAGEAFGTAHHATTESCLVVLERAARRHRIRRVLDLGCGSGVLAIAAQRALPWARVAAGDSDPKAVAVAAANVRANGLAGRIRPVAASGVPRRRASADGYDLVLANILAEPLVRLAPVLARAVASAGLVVLSGMLSQEAARVRAAYGSHGFALLEHLRRAGWSTLVLVRRRSAARGRARRAG